MTAEHLPQDLADRFRDELSRWQAESLTQKLWAKDASVWTGQDEHHWLGWLAVAVEMSAQAHDFRTFAGEVARDGFTHVLLLGMGGSSLCPEVLRLTLPAADGAPKLLVLDSTDPEQVRATESQLNLSKTLVIVSTKSGGTLEPNILKDYFFAAIERTVGAGNAARQFVAITDPGSPFETVARDAQFRRVFYGDASIGGRYSALSAFGMVPAAVAGFDFEALLSRAVTMAARCGPDVAATDNPGLRLGLILGCAARLGRDKVTLLTTPRVASLGTWLEQLLAESTGKQGLGLIPIDREPLGPPEVYGHDRVFVTLELASDDSPMDSGALDALIAAGHPVVRITLADVLDLGGEFFRWEFATAVAGAVLGINPFDQPDVEASKVATKKLTGEVESTGHLPAEEAFLRLGSIKAFASEANRARFASSSTLPEVWQALLAELKPGDYFAVLAYLPMTEAHDALLTRMRLAVRHAKRVATCGEFGPRFLHSTGQAYKGGPNTGVFLQLTCDDAADLDVPGKPYTFGVVKAAQARGDLAVLEERSRRAVRLHLSESVTADLARLADALDEAVR